MAEAQANRAIVHVDLDAFYAQVEQHRDPDRLLGKPTGVVQYNPFGDLKSYQPDDDRLFNNSNGSLIAVSYEARARGVKRGARGDDARKACPELQLVQVPTAHGKAELTLYRQSGKKVMDILGRTAVCERASIDECYLDLSAEARKRLSANAGRPPRPSSFERVHVCAADGPVEDAASWWERGEEEWGEGERLLACAAGIMVELRAAVKEELHYTCSAGIAHNKILAKLASGMHKPAAQTVCPLAGVPRLLQDLPVPKLRQLGGKFGASVMAKLGISTVGELATFSMAKLDSHFGESNARWLYSLAHGCDEEEVKQRTLPKSLSCGKTFRGHTLLQALPDVHKWLVELGGELQERIGVDKAANHREPRLLTAHWAGISRSCALSKCDAASIAHNAHELVKRWAAHESHWGIDSLYLAASNFAPVPTGTSIARFLKAKPQQQTSPDSGLLSPDRSRSPILPNASSLPVSSALSGLPDQTAGGMASISHVSDSAGPGAASCSRSNGQARQDLQSVEHDRKASELMDEVSTLQTSMPMPPDKSRAAAVSPCAPSAQSSLHEPLQHQEERAEPSGQSAILRPDGQQAADVESLERTQQHVALHSYEGQDIDEDVLMALPPELKHEIRLATMGGNRKKQSEGRGSIREPAPRAAHAELSQRQRPHGLRPSGNGALGKRGLKRPASIAQFFAKHK